MVKIQLKKVIIYKSILENSKKDKPLKANFAAFANALCHLNATPLSVAVLAPCAWGENLATRQIQLGKYVKMGQCLGGGLLSLSLSLSLLALFGTLKFLNALFLGFCALFVILSVAKNPKNLRYALFMDTSLTLSMNYLCQI